MITRIVFMENSSRKLLLPQFSWKLKIVIKCCEKFPPLCDYFYEYWDRCLWIGEFIIKVVFTGETVHLNWSFIIRRTAIKCKSWSIKILFHFNKDFSRKLSQLSQCIWFIFEFIALKGKDVEFSPLTSSVETVIFLFSASRQSPSFSRSINWISVSFNPLLSCVRLLAIKKDFAVREIDFEGDSKRVPIHM